jgi:RNA polymerase sigma-70 factor (ECF subfamily)
MDGRHTERRQTADFVRLFTQHARDLYVYIQVLLHDDVAADDAFQEVSLQLWEDFSKFQSGSDFYAWAKQVAYFKVLHHHTRRQREEKNFSALLATRLTQDLEHWGKELGAQRQALAACVDRLSAEDRDLIERRYSPRATVKLVAEQVGCSIDSVYRSLRRIHQMLFRCVTRTLRYEGGS